MTTVRDIVRVTNTATTSSDLPGVDTPEGLRESAHLVWQLLTTKLNANNKAPIKQNDGVPGRTWQGKILLDVFHFIWPHMNDRMHISKTDASDLFEAVVDYLKQCKMLQCKQPGTQYNSAVWWVSDYWTPTVNAPKNTAVEPAKATEADGVMCRQCGQRCETTTSRGSHEFHAHNIAVTSTGEIVSYADFTEETADEIMLLVFGEAKEPLTLGSATVASHDIDPRMGNAACKATLARLLDQGKIQTATIGYRPTYSLAPQKAAQPEPETVPSKPVAAPEPQYALKISTVAPEVRTVAPVHTDLSALLDRTQKGLVNAASAISQAAVVVGTLADHCGALEEKLSLSEQKVASLKMQLIAKGAASGPEVDALRAQVQQLTEERDTAQGERDGYRDRLEKWQSALQGLGVSNGK
jgi:hypothetical protein